MHQSPVSAWASNLRYDHISLNIGLLASTYLTFNSTKIVTQGFYVMSVESTERFVERIFSIQFQRPKSFCFTNHEKLMLEFYGLRRTSHDNTYSFAFRWELSFASPNKVLTFSLKLHNKFNATLWDQVLEEVLWDVRD